MHQNLGRARLALLFSALCLTGGCLSTAQPPASTATSPALTPLPPVQSKPAINPLTGQPVADAGLLQIPAVLISITHFPALARPQAGLSFAPFVYEFYITEGATRFLAVFYGEFPRVDLPVQGGCETRTAPFAQTGTLLGNRVWLDSNSNGLQDPGEGGISGLCVNLYDARGNMLARTSSDSNGLYGFNVTPGDYSVEFVRPPNLLITAEGAGDRARDSDADPGSGRVSVHVSADLLSVDVGLVPAPGTLPTTAGDLPAAQVGPIRSGRLIYHDIAHYFQNSCLIFGSASPEVLVHLPQCLTVFHQLGGGGFMLDLKEMRAIARENARRKGADFDYSGNTYADEPLAGAATARVLRIFVAYQNQSAWFYDPLYQAYVRYVDTSALAEAGVLHADTDRLTQRQLHFENVIVLYARHDVVTPTNLDIHLDPGKTGKALLFRDGHVFKAEWRTSPDPEEGGGGPRPIQFRTREGRPLALKPGHTWIIVVTPETTVESSAPGEWQLTFSPPEGAK